jgi:hypothetical protein
MLLKLASCHKQQPKPIQGTGVSPQQLTIDLLKFEVNASSSDRRHGNNQRSHNGEASVIAYSINNRLTIITIGTTAVYSSPYVSPYLLTTVVIARTDEAVTGPRINHKTTVV